MCSVSERAERAQFGSRVCSVCMLRARTITKKRTCIAAGETPRENKEKKMSPGCTNAREKRKKKARKVRERTSGGDEKEYRVGIVLRATCTYIYIGIYAATTGPVDLFKP